MLLTKNEVEQYNELGFIIKQILSDPEVEYYKDQINTSHLAKLSAVSDKMVNAQFLQPKNSLLGVQQIICNPSIKRICLEILGGGRAIIDGASVLCCRVGVDYRQGWHRDIMQIPDSQISLDWFSNKYFHNNVQVNLALLPDSCLWLVRGSHKRNFTLIEAETFAGSLKIAPLSDIQLPDSLQIKLKPGEAVFYNNNSIHRGYAGKSATQRMTIQLGYHSNLFAPSPHFGVINHHEFNKSYLDSLFPEVKTELLLHIAERNRYPESEEYYRQHQEFIMHAFRV
jgi:hypothetical protein